MRHSSLLRLAGATLMLIAVLAWGLVSFESGQTAASQFFFAVYSDAPGAMADPSLTLRDGGNALELHLFANATVHARVIVRADSSCSPSIAGPSELQISDVTLSPGAVQTIRCGTNRPPRSISFTRREVVIGMLRPATIPRELVRNLTPAHQVRASAASDTFDAGAFSGGLDDAVVQTATRMPASTDETNQRYLSRYGAGYQPAVAIDWSDRRAQLLWAFGLAIIAILVVLCANAFYGLITAT